MVSRVNIRIFSHLIPYVSYRAAVGWSNGAKQPKYALLPQLIRYQAETDFFVNKHKLIWNTPSVPTKTISNLLKLDVSRHYLAGRYIHFWQSWDTFGTEEVYMMTYNNMGVVMVELWVHSARVLWHLTRKPLLWLFLFSIVIEKQMIRRCLKWSDWVASI
jgi:hypothetical protein